MSADEEKRGSDVWSIRDVIQPIRNRARDAAKRDGKKLSDWLTIAIINQERADLKQGRELVSVDTGSGESEVVPVALKETVSGRPTATVDQLTDLLNAFGVDNLTKTARSQISSFMAEQFKNKRLPKD